MPRSLSSGQNMRNPVRPSNISVALRARLSTAGQLQKRRSGPQTAPPTIGFDESPARYS